MLNTEVAHQEILQVQPEAKKEATESESSSDGNDSDGPDPEDKIFAEFTNIKRTRVKFKCEFRNAILHIRGQDYVMKQLSCDIDY